MTSSYDAAQAWADRIESATTLFATEDPRAATPPCVLIPPPDRVRDIACGYTARWSFVVMVPGPANADAHKQLSTMVDALEDVVPYERATLTAHVMSPDAPAVPAYRLEFSEGI